MPSLERRRGVYYAVFYDAMRTPKRRRISLQTKRREDAQVRFAAFVTSWNDGRYDPWDPHASHSQPSDPPLLCPELDGLREAADAFFETKAHLSPSARRMYRLVVDGFVATAGEDLKPSAVRPAHVRAFLAGRSLNDTSTATYLRHLRVFVRWLLKEKLIAENPLEDVEWPRKPQKLPKSVTEDELQAVCIAVVMDYQEKRETGFTQEGDLVWRIPLVLFAFCTGMRASELARLRWRDLDLDKRLITIRKQKNQKEQTIPLNVRAVAVLEMVESREAGDYVFAPPGGATGKRAVRPFVERASKTFREARRAAGIERRITFHGLRHGFCTKLAEAGKPLYVIKEAARHADVSTSMIYVHMANEHLKGELDDVFS